MENNDLLRSAKQAIQDILQKISIKRVIYVDDFFSQDTDITKIIGLFQEALNKNHYKTKALMKNIDFESPPEVWIQSLKDNWNQLSPIKRQHDGDLITVL